jgi:hypothetical protein
MLRNIIQILNQMRHILLSLSFFSLAACCQQKALSKYLPEPADEDQ